MATDIPLRKLSCAQVQSDLLWNPKSHSWELQLENRRFPVGLVWLQGNVRANPKFDSESFNQSGSVWEGTLQQLRHTKKLMPPFDKPLCDSTHKRQHTHSQLRPVRFIPDRDMQVWFCGCKQTKNRPFCDGTHKTLEEGVTTPSMIEGAGLRRGSKKV